MNYVKHALLVLRGGAYLSTCLPTIKISNLIFIDTSSSAKDNKSLRAQSPSA